MKNQDNAQVEIKVGANQTHSDADKNNRTLTKALKALMEGYWGRVPEEQRESELLHQAWIDLWSKANLYLSEEDVKGIGEAFVFGAFAHNGQRRYSGEPYITHPISVAAILASMELDKETIQAAILHDVLEDTFVKSLELETKFGKDVLTLVDGVTKLGKLQFKSVEDYQSENLRKMFVVMARDIRVVMIKLADRMHNMRTISSHRLEKQKRIAKETLEIYAPLAHRLGIYQIKRELEDISFKILDPEMYHDIKKRLKKKLPERETAIQQAMTILSERLGAEGIAASIKGRPKHFYSIYEKMQRKGIALEQLYDLLAIRVILDNVTECYQVLGIVHTIWKPIPGQFDDYIANPKPNMYQSLHTTVIGPSGDPLEIQIRTWEMNTLAEYGIAAHWNYKEGLRCNIDNMDKQLNWIRKAIEESKQSEESGSGHEFLDSLKTDILSQEVFVFTPNGKVISIPTGSTPIDFAYAVHTEIGHKCVGAMVNGRIAPMDYQLKNGDIVKIITSPQATPSRDWLKLAKSSRTRNKIKAWFRQFDRQEREEKIRRGKELLEKEAVRRMPKIEDPMDKITPQLNQIAREIGYLNLEELFFSVGSSNISPSSVVSRISLKKTPGKDTVQPVLAASKNLNSEIIVDGAQGVLVSLAQCCRPIPGDDIIGHVSQQRGITVHRRDCANVVDKSKGNKTVNVIWGLKRNKQYTARLRIEGTDKANLVGDIVQAITAYGGGLVSIKASVVNNTRMRVTTELNVRDLEHLFEIIGKINSISGIMEVFRG